MNTTIRPLLFSCLMLMSAVTYAEEMVVVAHPRSGIDRLSRAEVINIFMGRFRQLPSGISAQPVDLPQAYPEKARFYRALVNKDLAEINSYWSRLVFSGRTAPPMEAKNHEDLINIISRTPGAVGYIARSKLDARVKLVYELGDPER